ncbi:MAG: PadR family transcriptional regulator [Microbacterium sp.]
MSVRQSLLAILDQGPCYGYQLRAEFDRRTGSTWPLNVGQIYNTLDRLERDGLVAKRDVDDRGHVYWQITDAGAAEVRDWFGSPVPRAGGTRDELAIKLALSATLPGGQAGRIIQAQRRESRARLDALTSSTYSGAGGGPEELAWSIVTDAMIAAAEAELHWLDRSAERLARHPEHALALALATDRPKRGRPARTE